MVEVVKFLMLWNMLAWGKKPNYFELCPIISAVGYCGFLQDPLSKETRYTWKRLASCKEYFSVEWNICFLER